MNEQIEKDLLQNLHLAINNNQPTQEHKNMALAFFGMQPAGTLKKLKKKEIGNFLLVENIIEYFKLQNKYVALRISQERKRAWNFLNDEKEAEKYNFVNEIDYKPGGKYYDENLRKPTKKMPKQTDQQIENWANLAYPNIDEKSFEGDFNKFLLGLSIE